MPLLRTKVVVSRHYDNPQITVKLYRDAPNQGPHDRIELELSVEDFLKAVANEIGLKRFGLFWRPSSLATLLIDAADPVVENAKESGVHGMLP